MRAALFRIGLTSPSRTASVRWWPMALSDGPYYEAELPLNESAIGS